MSRRRSVVLVSAALLLALAVVLVLAAAVVTQTPWGRDRIRAFAESRIRNAIGGTIHLGRISGSLFTNVIIDSVEIRGPDDSLFAATGRLEVHFDPRNLLEQRLILSGLRVANASVNLRQDSTGRFNFRDIFPSNPNPGPPRTAPGWGDYIVVDEGVVERLDLVLRTRWDPPDELRGRALDSAINRALTREDKEIRRVPGGYEQVRRFANARLELTRGRLDDKDANGRTFDVRRIDVDISDPPFAFRGARGTIRLQGDSLWADVADFRLPGSRGSMSGKVWWGNNLPARFDLTVKGDTVSLADIQWVYPTLPREGGGRMKLAIRSEADPGIVDYVITDMDVRTTASRLRGDLTFGVGGPLLILKDVDLLAQPLDFRLIETFTGEPLPLPWRGTLEGRLIARGGPLDRFVVDSAEIVFTDENVPGAGAAGRARGALDISEPAFTVFHGLAVHLDRLDLRTLQFLNPAFPRLNGIIAGRATLDSSWLDVRFRDADITHRYGETPATRMTGAGRVTFGEQVTTYDVALHAQPLAFLTFARAYAGGRIPLRGEYQGPLRMQGSTADLAISTELRGTSGTLAYDGRVDADSAGGYGAHGTLRLVNADLRTLLDTVITPTTSLNGSADLDLTGDSLANLSGAALVQLDRSLYDDLRVHPSRVRVRFADQRLIVDTLFVETVLGRAMARGALGLRPDVRDSLIFALAMDSLGGLRRYISGASTAEEAPNGDGQAAVDSLAGEADIRGVLIGSVDTLGVRAALDGVRLVYNGLSARVVRGRVELADAFRAPTGAVNLSADTVSLAGVRLRDIGVDLTVDAGRTGRFNVMSQAANGAVLTTRGDFAVTGDTSVVRIDSLGVLVEGGQHRLTLTDRSAIRVEPSRVVIDTLRLRGANGEELVFAASVPDSAPMSAAFRVDSLHLGDLGELLQTRLPLGGTLSARVSASGTRQAPLFDLTGTILGASVGQVTVASVRMEGSYGARRLTGDVQMVQQGARVLEGTLSLPVDLALESRSARWLGSDTMRVSLRSQDVDLGLVETFTPVVRNSSGRFSADFDLVGPARGPLLTGTLRIDDGAATLPDINIRLRNVNADLVASQDTLRVNRLVVVSGEQTSDSLWLTRGNWIASPLDSSRSFDLNFRARNFHAIGLPTIADLYMSADVALRGTWDNSVAQGAVTVNSGHVGIPDLPDKQLFPIRDPEVLERNRETLERLNLLPRTFGLAEGLTVQDLTVRVGPDVWLRSDDANIKLADSLNVTVSRPRGGGEPQLALEGTLRTERGFYVLNLGVVRPSFTIESGEIRFFGDTTFNPELDITAIHRVRQISSTYGGRHDVRIGVRLRGTLEDPEVDLLSADSLQLSDSDLISYLVTGAPSFGIGGGSRENVSTASRIVLGGLSSAFSSFATRWTGGLFDVVQLQIASDQARVGGAQRYGLLEGAQLGIGKQLNDQTFVSLNTGFCPFLPQGTLDPSSVWNSLGWRLEHTFGMGYGVSVSREPPFNALVCSRAIPPGFLTSEAQWGFDFFRTWRF